MEFYLPEICKILGVKKQRIHQWLRLGYISPSLKVATKPGVRNIFSHEDLYRCAIFKYLLEGGFTREICAELIKSIDEGSFKRLVDVWLFDTMNIFKWKALSDKGKEEVRQDVAKGSGLGLDDGRVNLVSSLANKTFVEWLENRFSDVFLYLVFLQIDYRPMTFRCLAMGQNTGQLQKIAGKPISRTALLNFEDLPTLTRYTAFTYVLNWDMVIEPVDTMAMELFPEKYANELERVIESAGSKNQMEEYLLKHFGTDWDRIYERG